jgi:hypothetical protein
MFYALLIICPAVAPACDLDRAVYAEQSPPIFASEDQCVMGALAHLREISLPQLKADTEYQIEIECEMTEEPA